MFVLFTYHYRVQSFRLNKARNCKLQRARWDVWNKHIRNGLYLLHKFVCDVCNWLIVFGELLQWQEAETVFLYSVFTSSESKKHKCVTEGIHITGSLQWNLSFQFSFKCWKKAIYFQCFPCAVILYKERKMCWFGEVLHP